MLEDEVKYKNKQTTEHPPIYIQTGDADSVKRDQTVFLQPV